MEPAHFPPSLRKVNDFPFFTARYRGDYRLAAFLGGAIRSPADVVPFFEDLFSRQGIPVKLGQVVPPPRLPACSAFFARTVEGGPVVGKNLDWKRCPVLLLHTRPAQGFASYALSDLDLCDLFGLGSLDHSLALAPYVPFDGINEAGLVVSMLSVLEPCTYPRSEHGPSVGDFNLIRVLLDTCATAEDAVATLRTLTVLQTGPLPVHYLIADQNRACIVEFVDGDVREQWAGDHLHLTNHLVTKPGARPRDCPRFERLHRHFAKGGGGTAQGLLRELEVRQPGFAPPSTIWSVVFSPGDPGLKVRVGDEVYRRVLFPGT